MPFLDRRDAGRRLARQLERLRGCDVVVLGLPRGGVPVAFEVARALGAPLDVVVVRKLGVPMQPELAMGAVGEGGVTVVDQRVVALAGVGPDDVAHAEERERAELARRARRFRGDRPRVPLDGRTVVIVDDGIATGSTARAAGAVVRAQGAGRVVLAAPVCAPESARALAREFDEVVCLEVPRRFAAVGRFYDDFRPTDDEEVVELLGAPPVPPDEEVTVPAGGVDLPGTLTVPPGATGLVVFVHGSGSSRSSPRNRYVAGVLQAAGLGTLLFDLLTAAEEGDRAAVFDIDLLAARLGEATAWLRAAPGCGELPVGWFGASTGAAAALTAAADDDAVRGVVSRGGRPDLAGPRLGDVRAPTLLVVGGADRDVLELNRQAQARLRCVNRLAVVPGAGHLFEEPGTLQAAAALARDWFLEHLVRAAPGQVAE
ncbi:phosphoribosyltransferase family protein [Geodermatophilus sabuli]|uniref:Putative phosphoribosyl transferase n=1 Tax=Geodermatophilus sabuli TaxID=1564158 RepID=A0A285E893_9ACTN|nr:phosphoribosyltransferase family protein [Geodermatophilus sabuli]MBB3082808.1 putative phosphoribosyl transferase [Geodermatophilus sabuli]SNX94326.1 putative phosphoribosyl transferase [Geodermatophilus sabuli]